MTRLSLLVSTCLLVFLFDCGWCLIVVFLLVRLLVCLYVFYLGTCFICLFYFYILIYFTFDCLMFAGVMRLLLFLLFLSRFHAVRVVYVYECVCARVCIFFKCDWSSLFMCLRISLLVVIVPVGRAVKQDCSQRGVYGRGSDKQTSHFWRARAGTFTGGFYVLRARLCVCVCLFVCPCACVRTCVCVIVCCIYVSKQKCVYVFSTPTMDNPSDTCVKNMYSYNDLYTYLNKLIRVA